METYQKGDRVDIQITGLLGHYTAVIREVDQRGHAVRVELEENKKWPILKTGDFIVYGKL